MRFGLSLSLNSPNCFAYVNINITHDTKINPDARMAANELIPYDSFDLSAYWKCTPTPKAMLKALNIIKVRRPSFIKYFDTDESF